jgi:hypothetical protein
MLGRQAPDDVRLYHRTAALRLAVSIRSVGDVRR